MVGKRGPLSNKMKTLPIACELTPAELQARREGLLPGLLALAQERVAIANGVRWVYQPASPKVVFGNAKPREALPTPTEA